MARKILIAVLTFAVLIGAYLGISRYLIELQDKTVELCVDLNDLKKVAALERRPLTPLLQELKKAGFNSVGVFEETLVDAAAAGELYYAKGSGLTRLKGLIPHLDLATVKPERTYIYVPEEKIRRRVMEHLPAALNIGNSLLEINEAEEQLRALGLGISETQQAYLANLGFEIIPRVRDDQGDIEEKFAALAGHRLIIFDGDDLLGYPSELSRLAEALKKNGLKYGYIEIVKQSGDVRLRRLMDKEVIRVHSIPPDELKKINEPEALVRFVRAVQERKVKLIYVRPFLPPQTAGSPVAYNLKYFSNIKQNLQGAGIILGRAENTEPFKVKGWEILILGAGVIIGALLLFNLYRPLSMAWMFLLLILFLVFSLWLGSKGQGLLLQKGLAWLAAIVFPTYGVVVTFSGKRRADQAVIWDAALLVINVVAETFIGVFLMIGLLADYRFALGIETFAGVKFALVLPVLLVALYFFLKSEEGGIKDKLLRLLNLQVKLGIIIIGLLALAVLGLLVARSGNFILPVPGFEKTFRDILETIMSVRPRTKEFLFGYPLLFIAAVYLLKGRSRWLWLLAALGTVAPISVFNTFSHIHTPLVVSLTRTVNGLVLGLIVGILIYWLAAKFIKWDEV